jgi:hypothetical protein
MNKTAPPWEMQRMVARAAVLATLLLSTSTWSHCQTAPVARVDDSGSLYSSLNTWSVFGEFAPSAHRIILGRAEQRRTVDSNLFQLSYSFGR